MEENEGAGFDALNACGGGHFFEDIVFGAGVKNNALWIEFEDVFIPVGLSGGVEIKADCMNGAAFGPFGMDGNMFDGTGFKTEGIYGKMFLV